MYCTFANTQDILSIIEIQMSNHKVLLSKEEQKSKGFVTLLTPPSFIENIILNRDSYSKIIVAKNDSKEIIGYLIAIMKEDAQLNFFMNDFVKEVDKLTSIKPTNTMYIAQIGVTKNFQGKGAGKLMYKYLFNHIDDMYEEFDIASIITEVSSENIPSQKFHITCGFKEIHKYPGPGGTEFIIIEKRGNMRTMIA